MNQDNRVLQRVGARELTWDEVEHVSAAINTLTAFCSVPQPKYPNGDSDHEGCHF